MGINSATPHTAAFEDGGEMAVFNNLLNKRRPRGVPTAFRML